MCKPHPGFQEGFAQRAEFEALSGGAAGPGKTDLLIALATRHLEHPKYHGLILRRTRPRLREILDRCHEVYSDLGGEWKSQDKRFIFPSGAKITLGHCQHEEWDQRMRRRAEKTWARIGGEYGKKPKRMHWRTYNRLVDQARYFEDLWLYG